MKFLFFLSALCLLTASTRAADSIYDVPLVTIDGKAKTLKPGKVLLIVNVASHCGNTKQYAALEAIYKKYQGRGFEVLGFPCNQFGGQEPGTAVEIKEFCSSKYQVSFPLFEKLEVNGPNRHPLYGILAGSKSPFPGDIKWNFAKFLISRDGKILARFEPGAKPDSTEAIAALEAALGH
jgi:glutathione peroxidase